MNAIPEGMPLSFVIEFGNRGEPPGGEVIVKLREEGQVRNQHSLMIFAGYGALGGALGGSGSPFNGTL